ncbi:DUF2920 family protein [Campylobacter avium]|uniref:DUF2920 family protein n=1 Tax=Campylobacter avium TaxID=522485 RepID=UPI0023574599|nr:DUF2920 family protein [Campylobacter avium]
MLQTKEYKIKSCDDVELNIKRESLLEFSLTFDDEKEIEAILFIIPGLGEDNNSSYLEHLASYSAQNFNVAVCLVQYHCIGNRTQTGCKVVLDDLDIFILSQACSSIGINIPKKFMPLNKLQITKKEHLFFDFLDKKIAKLKADFEIARSYRMNLSVTLIPTKNEYNNFGIMSATDIVNALLHIKKNPPFKISNGGGRLKHIFLGTSHGGYLAHLVAKISPWNVDCVVDNSGYAIIPWRFIGFGKEIDYTLHSSTGIIPLDYEHFSLRGFDKTMWNSNKFSPNYFSNARSRIRNILDEEHLKIQAKSSEIKYISYHSILDDVADANDKIKLYDLLNDLGFDAKLTVVRDTSQIDGKFIKNLSHGMKMSIKTLISKSLQEVLNYDSKKDTVKKEISYPSDEILYTFKEDDDSLRLSCEKI